MSRVSPTERQRVAGLALRLVREHEPALEELLTLGWSSRFTSRLGDATYVGRFHLEQAAARGLQGVRLGGRKLASQPMARARFSEVLWAAAGRTEQDATVAHEIAHLIVYHRYAEALAALSPRERAHTVSRPRKPEPHGREWQRVMRELGYEPERCHSVTAPSSRRPHTLHCHACGATQPVSRRAHQRAAQAEARGFARGGYYCRCSTRGHRHYLHTTPKGA